MSWDVLLLRVPDGCASIAELPDDFVGEPLGAPEQIVDALRRALPSIDLSDRTWGVLEADDYSIEFNIGRDEPCTAVMLHVRGPESVIVPIEAVCDQTGWSAFDTSTGARIDFAADPARGLRSWIAFRAKAGIAGPLKGISIPLPMTNPSSLHATPAASAIAARKKKWWHFWR